MTLTERCQASEAKLEQIANGLLDPRPEILEHCEAELHEVIALLENGSADSPAVSRAELNRLRERVRLLALQAQHAAHLCQGWAQLGVSQGYTEHGDPVLPLSEPHTSYEV